MGRQPFFTSKANSKPQSRLIEDSVKFRLDDKSEDKTNSSNLGARTLLGKTLLKLGAKDQAEVKLREVRDIWMEIDQRNPCTLKSRCDWGNALRAQHNNAALEEHRGAFDVCISAFNWQEPVTFYCGLNFAQTLSEFGKTKEAEDLFRLVTTPRRWRALPPAISETHWRHATSLRSIFQKRSVPEALPYAQQALDGRLALLGENHPDTKKAKTLVEKLMLVCRARTEAASARSR